MPRRLWIGVVCMVLACLFGLLPKVLSGSQIVCPQEAYTHDMLRDDLMALQRKYPEQLCVEVIGYSREGRAIYAARAGNKNAPVRVLMHAGIHAREHMTNLLVMAQLERLLRRGIPDWVVFYFVPMVNPDGAFISQTKTASQNVLQIYAADRAAGYSDEPCEQYLARWKANAVGVDLNRNFDAQWEKIDSHSGPSSAFYRGQSPLSEPETQALAAYTLRVRPDITISYHAMGEEIYYDFGANTPINEAGYSLAQAVARCTGYKPVPDDYTSFGGYKDWAIEKLSIPSLTIEVGSVPAPLPISEFASIWKKNRDVPMAAAKWAREWLGIDPRQY